VVTVGASRDGDGSDTWSPTPTAAPHAGCPTSQPSSLNPHPENRELNLNALQRVSEVIR